jgi:C_GCAxxG_C_C family probable redox protein
MADPILPDREKLDEVEKTAHDLMETYHGCAQCVHLAIQNVSGLKCDLTAKAVTGFSGGFGGLQSLCGALTGAALALGMKYGRDPAFLQGPPQEAIEKQNEASEQVARLAKWFEREFGSLSCREIRRAHMGTDLDIGIPWQKEWVDHLGMRKHCMGMVARTARRTLAMLEDPKLDILTRV